MSAPKKKNRQHIQPVLHLPREVEDLIRSEGIETDLAIKRIIKTYRRLRQPKSKATDGQQNEMA